MSSAGVYDSTGMLVRTLWNAVDNAPGEANPAAAWDGLLDDRSVAPAGNYTVKVLTHACTYTWEGVVGNTSPNHGNPYVTLPFWNQTIHNEDIAQYHNYACSIVDMAITDAGEMYFTTSYDERWNPQHVMTMADLTTSDYIGAYRSALSTCTFCCTDGT